MEKRVIEETVVFPDPEPQLVDGETIDEAVRILVEGMKKPPGMSEGFFRLVSTCWEEMLNDMLPVQIALKERTLQRFFDRMFRATPGAEATPDADA